MNGYRYHVFLSLIAIHTDNVCRVVAQLGSALDWGSRGRRFKSCQPDHYTPEGFYLQGCSVLMGRNLKLDMSFARAVCQWQIV